MGPYDIHPAMPSCYCLIATHLDDSKDDKEYHLCSLSLPLTKSLQSTLWYATLPTSNRHVYNCDVSIFNQVSPNVKHRCVSRPHEQFNLEDDSAAAAADSFSILPGGAGGVCYFLSVRQCCCPLVFCMLWYLWLLVIYDKTFSHRLLI